MVLPFPPHWSLCYSPLNGMLCPYHQTFTPVAFRLFHGVCSKHHRDMPPTEHRHYQCGESPEFLLKLAYRDKLFFLFFPVSTPLCTWPFCLGCDPPTLNHSRARQSLLQVAG